VLLFLGQADAISIVNILNSILENYGILKNVLVIFARDHGSG